MLPLMPEKAMVLLPPAAGAAVSLQRALMPLGQAVEAVVAVVGPRRGEAAVGEIRWGGCGGASEGPSGGRSLAPPAKSQVTLGVEEVQGPVDEVDEQGWDPHMEADGIQQGQRGHSARLG
eukprot:scaffold5786_cov19-Tisochrysis_lutea.AAC.1